MNKINDEEITYITEKGKTWVDLGVPAKVGTYRRWTLFIGPRPLFGHGVHRYLWEVVALDQELDELLRPTREELAKAIEGKVLGWGDWVVSKFYFIFSANLSFSYREFMPGKTCLELELLGFPR